MNRDRDKPKRIIKKQFWMNETEDNDLKQKSNRVCLSEAALIRMLIKGYEPREKPGEEFFQYMRQLSAIGNNINQIAARVNSLGLFDAEKLEKEVSKLHHLEADLEERFLLPKDTRGKWQ